MANVVEHGTVSFDQECGNFLESYQDENGKFKSVPKFKATHILGWTSSVKEGGKGGNPMVRIFGLNSAGDEVALGQCRTGQLVRVQNAAPKKEILVDAEGNSIIGKDSKCKAVAFQLNADEEIWFSIDDEGTLILHL